MSERNRRVWGNGRFIRDRRALRNGCAQWPGEARRLRPWELALALAVAAAVLEGIFAPGAAVSEAAVTANWWTVMFPGLSELPGAGAASGGAEPVELRWLVVELLRALFGR